MKLIKKRELKMGKNGILKFIPEKEYNNPYKKHIAVEETVWAELRKYKRLYKLHSLNEAIKQLMEGQ